MVILTINQGWDTRQANFSNAFVQATLVEYIYLALPSYYESDTGKDRANMSMKLNKSLYGLVQDPLYWYNCLKDALDSRLFKPSPLDPCMFYGRGTIELIYVDDALFFGTNQDKIDEVVK